ncbi:hypothetical protein GCM10010425_35400 [Streptomyces spororaveus]|uniref:Uncharacterized protein n=1 Tax=Streptomyces spororaveus TaxID=284039 RepID=A0ABQ3TBU3_9ACTN|nr:hypothetical protein Sspor_33770 [Streptomyces spororaveus]
MISCICGADLVVVAKFRAAVVPRLRCGAWAWDSEPAWTDMSFPFDHSMDLRVQPFSTERGETITQKGGTTPCGCGAPFGVTTFPMDPLSPIRPALRTSQDLTCIRDATFSTVTPCG